MLISTKSFEPEMQVMADDSLLEAISVFILYSLIKDC